VGLPPAPLLLLALVLAALVLTALVLAALVVLAPLTPPMPPVPLALVLVPPMPPAPPLLPPTPVVIEQDGLPPTPTAPVVLTAEVLPLVREEPPTPVVAVLLLCPAGWTVSLFVQAVKPIAASRETRKAPRDVSRFMGSISSGSGRALLPLRWAG
jgi:hypothetical protein